MTRFQFRFSPSGFVVSPPSGGLMGGLAWLGGMLAAGVAVAIGAVLAVFTAIAVAVFAVVAGVVMFFAGFALRLRRPQPRRAAHREAAGSDGVIEAHKEGDTWVAHGGGR